MLQQLFDKINIYSNGLKYLGLKIKCYCFCEYCHLESPIVPCEILEKVFNCTFTPVDDGLIHYFNSFHTEKVELSVKSELPATVKACTFEEQIKGWQYQNIFMFCIHYTFNFFDRLFRALKFELICL